MDYTSGGGTAAIAAGGATLAYTGTGDLSWIALMVGVLLVALGATLLFVMKRRNRRDARSAGLASAPARRNEL